MTQAIANQVRFAIVNLTERTPEWEIKCSEVVGSTFRHHFVLTTKEMREDGACYAHELHAFMAIADAAGAFLSCELTDEGDSVQIRIC